MNLSASALPLLMLCSAPAHDTVKKEKDRGSPSARFGTAVHAVLEQRVKQGADLFDLDQEVAIACDLHDVSPDESWRMAECAKNAIAEIDNLEANRTFVLLPEVKFAVDVETGDARVLNSKDARDYSDAKPTEIVGTADLVVTENNGSVCWVVDYKTGSSPAHDYDEQMRFLAFAALKVYRPMTGVVHGSCWQLTPIDRTATDVAIASDATADAYLERLRQLYRDATAEPKYQPGQHCKERWCKARKTCKAYANAVNEGLIL